MPALTLSQFLGTFGLTLFAGLSTAVGGAIALFHRKEKDSGRFLSAALGFSAGVMIYISLVELMAEASGGLRKACGEFQGGFYAVLAFLAGLLITLVIDKMVPEVENPHHVRKQAEVEVAVHATSEERAKLGRAGVVFALVIGIHNFPEGLATFAGGLSGMQIGIPIAIAIALHNIPEGMAVGVVYAGYLAGNAKITVAAAMALSIGIAIQNFPEGAIISLPLRSEGMGKMKAFAGGVLSGIVEPVGAVLTIMAAGLIVPALPYLLSFAAGAMLYVVVEELIPEMSAGEHSNIGTIFFAVGFSLMMILDVALG